jgi:hypothetical protein
MRMIPAFWRGRNPKAADDAECRSFFARGLEHGENTAVATPSFPATASA